MGKSTKPHVDISWDEVTVRAFVSSNREQRKLYAPKGADPTSGEHLRKRLLRGVGEINEHGCWLWGRTTSAGYGTLTVAHKTVRAHRLAFALANDRNERELDEICHDCPGGDNPLCINPAHLFEGTHGDNVRDAVRKGRLVPPSGPRLHGEENPAAKLTSAQVNAIRESLAMKRSQRDIASDYGVSQSTISNIAGGRRRQVA